MSVRKILTLAALWLMTTAVASAQGGSYFGVKGGFTLSQQQWSGFQRGPLLAPHAILFVETLPVEGRFSLFAQTGYHVKGSRLTRINFVNPFSGNVQRSPADAFKFYNLSLTLGAKQRVFQQARTAWYYLLGIRGEYTLDTNLDEYAEFNEAFPSAAIYPFDEPTFIRDINYGFTVGGGLELPFSEFVGMMLEFTLNPDFSFQYQQPAIPNVLDPFTNQTVTVPERQVRNLTLEVTLGFRFLRKVEYID